MLRRLNSLKKLSLLTTNIKALWTALNKRRTRFYLRSVFLPDAITIWTWVIAQLLKKAKASVTEISRMTSPENLTEQRM
jgi:hypothetical protein